MRAIFLASITLICATTYGLAEGDEWEANKFGRTIGWMVGCGCVNHDEETVTGVLEYLYPQFSEQQITSMKQYLIHGIKESTRYDNSSQICSSLCFGSGRPEYIEKFDSAVESHRWRLDN